MQQWLIVANNAGGAEILSSHIRRKNDAKQNFAFLLEGPAARIFALKNGVSAPLSRAEALAPGARYDFVLTGTSWGSDLELRALEFAKAAQIPSASFLDHWTNYRPRFSFEGKLILPDEIWVGDSYADEIARRDFPGLPVRLVENPYFLEMSALISRLSQNRPGQPGGERVLYLCEPTTAPNTPSGAVNQEFGYTEHQALAGFLGYLANERREIEAVRIRLHPSEPQKKYDEVIGSFRHAFRFENSEGSSLAEDCAWADRVVGCDTMALAVAAMAGKKAESCIPPGGKPLSLPFPGIKRLFEARNL